jgi:hypothetical protein
VALKKLYADKTNWQKMLKNDFKPVDLVKEKASIKYLIPKEVQQFYDCNQNDLYLMDFPVLEYPKKIVSTNLDKSPIISGKLIGIKAQYLIFEGGLVFNVRGNEGFVVKITI